MKKFFILLLTLPVLASCTRVIDLQLGDAAGQLVIEGNVTNTAGPQIIKLSRNVAVTNTNTYPPVTGATVTVTDQTGRSFAFTEGLAGTYSNSLLTGNAGNTYTMSVLTSGTTYKATSAIPPTVPFDSLTYKNDVVNTSKQKKIITVHYQDPAGVANQYRFLVWINNVQVKTVYAFNDAFNDGKNASLDLRVRDANNSDFGIYAGNTVTVEMQCIDPTIYTYWYTLMQQGTNGPGGGVSPADPPTNITPVALGYFSAHTTQSRTIVVK